MIKTSTQKILKHVCNIALLCMLFLCGNEGFAQKTDSVRITLRAKSTVVSRTPQIKANIPNYRGLYSNIPSSNKVAVSKSEKNMTVSKIYPNPVSDQVNIIIKLERESNLSIKILDILTNEVLTLSNEKMAAGEQNKNFILPKRLNTGIYFIRFIAGQESITKRISVL